jgi:murein DD-endopeptidase MepM/ murein hydrolase activator NlpD
MSRNKKSVTILFIPDEGGRTVSLHLRRSIVRSLVIFAVLFLGGMTCLVYLAGDIALKLQLVYSLRLENQKLQTENTKLLQLARKIEDIRRMNDYLSRLARSIGEGELNPGAQAARNAREREGLYASDSLDNLVENIRLSHAAPLNGIGGRARSAEELVDAVPYLRPVEGWVTKGFASADSAGDREHNGVDFAAPQGALIRAAGPGVVKDVRTDVDYGKEVTVEHKYGFVTRYGHCSQILVSVGSHVGRGQTIALVGSTGHSSAPHLHYEVVKDGKCVDPMRYILSRQQ